MARPALDRPGAGRPKAGAPPPGGSAVPGRGVLSRPAPGRPKAGAHPPGGSAVPGRGALSRPAPGRPKAGAHPPGGSAVPGRGAPYTWWRFSTLQFALFVSLAVHAALLTVHLVGTRPVDRAFHDAPLEVVLVNSRSGEAPEKAQAIAQANLGGGGDAAAGRATSPLPPSAEPQAGESAIDARRRIEQLQETQTQLLAQIRRELALLPAPDPQRDAGRPEDDTQEEHRRQLLQLLAEIEKRINEDNARPKKRYISPATREEVYAVYYDRLRRRIEQRGTRNFPESEGRKLYGELTMNVTIDAEGRVVDTEVVRPSASPALDRRAIAIVRAAAPFGPFSAPMRRTADQLVVTSRFRFTREDGLETTLSASPVP